MLKKLTTLILLIALLCCAATVFASAAQAAAPDSPSYVTAVSEYGGIDVEWGFVAGADSYDVYRKTEQGSWKKILNTEYSGYFDSKVKAGTGYQYKVAAVIGKKKSACTETKKAVVYVPAVRVWKAVVEDNVLTVKWFKTPGIHTYYFDVNEYDADGNWVQNLYYDDSLSKSATSYVYKKCKPGYRYEVVIHGYYEKDGMYYFGVTSTFNLYNKQ